MSRPPRRPRIGLLLPLLCPALALVAVHGALAEWTVVDDFESHPAGPLGEKPALWVLESGPEAFRIATHDTPTPGKHLEVTGLRNAAASLRHHDFSLPASPGAVCTFFGRIQFSGKTSERAFVHLLLGRASDTERPERAFEWRLSLIGEIPKLGIHRNVGHGTRELIGEAQPDIWISFWAVLRSSEHNYSLYLAPDDAPRAGPEHLLLDRADLRSRTPIELLRIYSEDTPRGATVRIDDLHVDRSGENLTRPRTGPRTAPKAGATPPAANRPATPAPAATPSSPAPSPSPARSR